MGASRCSQRAHMRFWPCLTRTSCQPAEGSADSCSSCKYSRAHAAVLFCPGRIVLCELAQLQGGCLPQKSAIKLCGGLSCSVDTNLGGVLLVEHPTPLGTSLGLGLQHKKHDERASRSSRLTGSKKGWCEEEVGGGGEGGFDITDDCPAVATHIMPTNSRHSGYEYTRTRALEAEGFSAHVRV